MVAAATASPLHSPIRVEFIGGPFVQLLTPVEWRGPFPDVLPADFVSDGGTIPSMFWPAVGHPLSASMLVLYLLHDWELQHGVAWGEARSRLDTRAKALGIADARRQTVVAGVFLKGVWNRITGR